MSLDDVLNWGVVYFDTNIFGEIAQCPVCWGVIRTFLLDNNLLLGVSEGTVLELSDAKRLVPDLSRFLISVPSVLIKPAAIIVDEEVGSYPNPRTETLVFGSLVSLLLEPDGLSKMESLFTRQEIRDSRRQQKWMEPAFIQRVWDTHTNFPPGASGQYTVEQGALYAFAIVAQWLVGSHPQFMKRFLDKANEFRAETFKSIWLFALVQFYMYYLHKRGPKRSDFGDFHHLSPFPYCRIIVVERYLCQVLQHIQNNDDVLTDASVYDIDFIRELTGMPLGA